MWLTVSLVLCWVIAAVELGRRGGRARAASYESVERQHRAFDALGAAAHRAYPAAPAPMLTAPAREAGQGPLIPGRVWGAAAVAALGLLALGMVAATIFAGDGRSAPGRALGDLGVSREQPLSPRPIPAPVATPAPVLTAVDNGAEVTVRVPSESFVVRLAARGPCWIGLLDPPDASGAAGRVLNAGGVLELPAHGRLVVRLGNPAAVDITVNGQGIGPVAAPGTARTLHFQGGPT